MKQNKRVLLLLLIILSSVSSESYNEDFLCNKDGLFAAFNCTKYYECIYTDTSFAYKILKTCPLGLLFDNSLQYCNWHNLVNCDITNDNGPIVNTPIIADTTSDESDTITDIPNTTTTGEANTVTDKTDTITETTAEVANIPIKTENYTKNVNSETLPTIQPTTTDKWHYENNPNTNEFKCIKDGFFPVYPCSAKYYQCIFTNTPYTKSILRSCPKGLFWDTKTYSCNWAYRVKCE
jgi:hypothetical protein